MALFFTFIADAKVQVMHVTMAIEMLFQWLSTSYINHILLYRQTVLHLFLLVEVCSFLKEKLNHSFVPILRGYIERCGTILHKGTQLSNSNQCATNTYIHESRLIQTARNVTTYLVIIVF